MGVWVSPKGVGIGQGEEICLSYGRGYWRARVGQLEGGDGADEDGGRDEGKEGVEQPA